ncbi:MAG: response regulator [Bacillota bacterium]|nr:response regulator [Bacillota bacterium]
MDGALIVSGTEKGAEYFYEILKQNNYNQIFSVGTSEEAQKYFSEHDFDLCIINAPLADEFGDRLAKNIISYSSVQVILVVKEDLFDVVSAKMDSVGVFTVTKPVSRQVLMNTLRLAGTVSNKLKMLNDQNKKLQQKIEDIRLVDRAKCILIEYLKMSEVEAHKYIEKQAMNLRETKRSIAESILKTYEG